MSDWAPWYLIAWRVIWFVPSQVCRAAFVLTVTIGWGPRAGADAWNSTL